jgi:hypothetical protein
MTQTISKQITRRALGLALLGCLAVIAGGQTQTAPPADARGVIRLRVRVKIGEATKGLPRKRFFLIKGSLEANKSVIQSLEQQPVISRDCYYRSIGASPQLIAWLKPTVWESCESVYCREVEEKDADAVPEFQHAVADGEKEFGNRDLARKWLAVFLSEEIRSGFYQRLQKDLQALIKQAEEVSKAKVMSVMTDRNGTAYFTDLEPGVYVISNILPTEIGTSTTLWNCEVRVKPGDLPTEKPFLISNPANKDPRDVKAIKCVSVEKPLPACPAPNK